MAQRRKTVKHFDLPGDAHFYTFSCFHHYRLLGKDRTRRWFVEAVKQAKQKHRFRLWAWVIMPEHAHLVVWFPSEGYQSEKVLQSIKVSVAKKAIAYLRRHSAGFLDKLKVVEGGQVEYRFWQAGPGFDRNLFEPRSIHEAIEYVHNNPVRRGLVERAVDWIWSSAQAWAGWPKPLLEIDRESVSIWVP